MKHSVNGSVISYDFEDGKPAVELDISKLSPDVVNAGALFGFVTVMRNATAGKMEDVEVARKAMEGRVALFKGTDTTPGAWRSAAEAKAAIGLTEDEKTDLIKQVVILKKRADGTAGQRTDAQIIEAFDGLEHSRKQAYVDSLKPLIQKRMNELLKFKKSAAKVPKAGADVGDNF